MDKLDILNREKFVEQLIRLTENISENKKGSSFAINGVWGCGKSFVLDMYEERLSEIQREDTADNKYFVIRYNCWKYDYYEEPLIAIVATMLSAVEKKTKLIPDSEKKSKILGKLKATGEALLSIANDAVKEKTGVDVERACKAFEDGEKEEEDSYKSKHEYDIYFGFNKVMEELIGLLQKLAEDYTIVFIVDELDRCLPEYAVKVLERLHHLTENQSNIISVISIDKKQLMKSIEHIFGLDNPEKYLEKFINFEIKLDNGEVSERIIDKYPDYIELFDKDIFPFDDPVEECIQAIFKGVDIRTQEQLVKKVMAAHKLLYADKKDYSFMCMELLLAVMICVCGHDPHFNSDVIIADSFDKIFSPFVSSDMFVFTEFFTNKFKKIRFKKEMRISSTTSCYEILPAENELYGAIIFTWSRMHLIHRGVIIDYMPDSGYEHISQNPDELKKFAEMIKIMQ